MKLCSALNEMEEYQYRSHLYSHSLPGPEDWTATVFLQANNSSVPQEEYLLSAPIARMMNTYVSYVLEAFGSKRIIFGSDWPVCNMGGPGIDSVDPKWQKHGAYRNSMWPKNWELWRQAVWWSILFNEQEDYAEDVFWRTAGEGYSITLDD